MIRFKRRRLSVPDGPWGFLAGFGALALISLAVVWGVRTALNGSSQSAAD